MGKAEDQVLGGWKRASDQGASLTKIGLLGDIKLSGSKLDNRRPRNG